jgi:hypothetical protein
VVLASCFKQYDVLMVLVATIILPRLWSEPRLCVEHVLQQAARTKSTWKLAAGKNPEPHMVD